MEPAALLRQLHAVFLSAGVEAAAFRALIPPQQPADGPGPLPVMYAMHGATLEATVPQLMAASANGAATIMHISTAQASFIIAITNLRKYVCLVCVWLSFLIASLA